MPEKEVKDPLDKKEAPEEKAEKNLPLDDDFEDEAGFDVDEWIGDDDWEEIEEDEEEEALDAPQFVDNGNGTISDSQFNLMWHKSDSFAEYGYGITWFEANDYIEELNEKKFGGFDDWRLPGFDEAKSMFAFAVSNQDKDGAEVHIDPLFAPGGGHNTWTYEEKPDYQQYAMLFSYITGNEKWEHKDNEFCHVRAVRDELKESWEPEWRSETKKFEG